MVAWSAHLAGILVCLHKWKTCNLHLALNQPCGQDSHGNVAADRSLYTCEIEFKPAL